MTDFIYIRDIEDTSVCDELIEYFKNSDNKILGEVYDTETGAGKVDKDKKDSIDLYLEECTDAVMQCMNELKITIEEYVKLYPSSVGNGPWAITERAKLQYYPPGAGFKIWHCERNSASPIIRERHLVYMMYLNDIDDEGGTEFFYQKRKVKPKKGRIVIWPADWTHTHRGVTSMTQEKYIVTGWYSFYNPKGVEHE